MAYTELKRGAKGKEVIRLQTLLNRVGAMLTADGDFGGGSDKAVKYAQRLAGQAPTGVADAKLWAWLEQQPEPSPLLPANCVAYIASEETGGLQYYESNARFPIWPGEASGITIGVGYDLRMNTAANFNATWKGKLPAKAMAELRNDIGKRGSTKRAGDLRAMGLEVPFHAAWSVFVDKSLPRYNKDTVMSFPELDSLPDDCRAVLISLVYNRGASVTGKGREEMAAIQQILAAAAPALPKAKRKAELARVEDQLLSMKRLWTAQGLLKRRQTEANMWRAALAVW